MQVDLSEHEIKILDAALQAWERDPERDSVMGGVMYSLLSRTAGEADEKRIDSKVEQMRKTGEKVTQDRRITATLLRAKLFQALTRASDHDVEVEVKPDPKPDL